MTYTFQDIPLAGDLLSVSQADLKGNFDYLQATLNKDHQIVFGNTNATTFEGHHTKVGLKGQTLPYSSAAALTADGEVGTLYAGNNRGLFWQDASFLSRILTPKAYAYATGTVPTIVGDSHNIQSITYSNPAGDIQRFTITFTNNIKNNTGADTVNYCVLSNLNYVAGGFGLAVAGAPSTKTANVLALDFIILNGSTVTDFNFIVWGG